MNPLNIIEDKLYEFDLYETNDPKNPVMGRIIIGNASTAPLEDIHIHDWKVVVLEIGLEYTNEKGDYEWYWEITVRDVNKTKYIVKKHKTGFNASYVPSGMGCSGIPADWAVYRQEVEDLAEHIIKDIKDNFSYNCNQTTILIKIVE